VKSSVDKPSCEKSVDDTFIKESSNTINREGNMTRKAVEIFHKEPEKYEIDFIVGIDDNPPEARNAMFYLRMESVRKETDRHDKAREIWLSSEELEKLSMLMSMASKFWKNHTLKKNTSRTQKRIAEFIEKWEVTRDFLF